MADVTTFEAVGSIVSMARTAWSRSVPPLVVALVLLTGLAGLTGCSFGKKKVPEQTAAQAYLNAFGDADSAGAAARTTNAAVAQAALTASLAGLGSGAKASMSVTGVVNRQSSSATANYDASWTLPGVTAQWKYSGTLPMVKQGKSWLVQWNSADIHPGLTTGSHLLVRRVLPTRAAVTDDKGAALFAPTPVVTVGVNTGAIANLAQLASTLAAVTQLQSSAADITSAVKAAGKNQFVPIITLRRPVYEQIKSRIHDLAGTEFQDGTELLPPKSGFARQLLGNVGQATKQIIDSSAGKIAAGDQVGLSGLQQALDAQLRGTPGVDVYAAADDGTTDSAGTSGTSGTKLGTVSAAVAGKPAQLTLDTATQEAADSALVSETRQASVVVTQPSTGRILAAANSASAQGDIALNGQFPAGSTFKLVTYTADFTANPSHDQNTALPCPATVNVDGRNFENENKFFHPTIPYSAAFGYSCNTTAINVADALPAGTMYRAAQALGLGASWKLPVDAFSGSMPATATGTEKAAEAIGQGKVLVSPLLMAEMVGASDTGKPITPSLLLDAPGTVGKSLDPPLTAKMQALMRATVDLPGASGYAALHDLPGDIKGKTGTAEFGTDVPPKSHSWFVATRGDLAVSVFIYGGENTGASAVQLARSFFLALPPAS
jgi:cell division protein FtsI/penicillin-binding protein 2